MLTTEAFLKTLNEARTDHVVVTTMGSVRPWGRISDSSLDFASADSAMGHVADLALGIALAQPDRTVICVNGDGSMLMSLGTLATIIGAGVKNLVLFVMQNGVYEITGRQRVPASQTLDFAGMARAAGFQKVLVCDTAKNASKVIEEALGGAGPTFVVAKVNAGNEGPISRSPSEQSRYLRMSLADAAHELRSTLMGSRDSTKV